MKKKTLIIIIISLMVVLSAILIISSVVSRNKGQETLFANSDYPVKYKAVDNGLEFKLDGSKTKEITWTATSTDAEYVDVAIKGKEKRGKATYTITPKKTGLVNVEFKKVGEVAGYSYNAVDIIIPIYVEETEKGIVASILDGSRLIVENNLCGETTDHPFFIENNDDGTVDLLFVKGQDDWVMEDPNGFVEGLSLVGNGESDMLWINPLSEETMKYNEDDGSDWETPTDAEVQERIDAYLRESYAKYGTPSDAIEPGMIVTDATEIKVEETDVTEIGATETDATATDATLTDASETDAMLFATPTDPYTTDRETTITLTSANAGVTVYIDVTIDKTGILFLRKGKAPEK